MIHTPPPFPSVLDAILNVRVTVRVSMVRVRRVRVGSVRLRLKG